MSPPELAVVVASVNGFPYVGECLESLRRHATNAEIVVADSLGEETRERIREGWPETKLLAFDEPTSVPELRAAGIAATEARCVAVIEDHCLVPEGWAEAIMAGHRTEHHVVGGAVRNVKTCRARDWAAFLCEYSAFMEPLPTGEVPDLTGMNVSYDRDAIAAIDDLLRAGRWENELHSRLRERGFVLWSEQGAVIEHAKDFGFLEFAAQRYHYSRSYAGRRGELVGRRRWLYALASPLLVPLMVARVARNVRGRPGHGAVFARSLPLIAGYSAIWAFGELVGYVFGGGRSLLAVR